MVLTGVIREKEEDQDSGEGGLTEESKTISFISYHLFVTQSWRICNLWNECNTGEGCVGKREEEGFFSSYKFGLIRTHGPNKITLFKHHSHTTITTRATIKQHFPNKSIERFVSIYTYSSPLLYYSYQQGPNGYFTPTTPQHVIITKTQYYLDGGLVSGTTS